MALIGVWVEDGQEPLQGHATHHQHRGQAREDHHEGEVVAERLATYPLPVIAAKEKSSL